MARWLFVYEGEVLASVFECGIWPASENLHLYYLWRRALGTFALVEDAPGHLFLKHELEDCATLIQLSFLFGWGLSCGDPAGERAFHVNHDGHSVLIARNLTDFDELVPDPLRKK